ncbi:MAG: biotin transporter BioY [Archaeoglobus sp.]|nr:biotin transporter BioY [Archaeoglobus sp.]
MVYSKWNELNIVLASTMAIFTGLTAQLSFKIGMIPYTMQNLGVVLSGLLLGPYWGFLSQVIYLLLIAIGLNLASGFIGGIGVFFGPTAGYLITFPLAAFLCGYFRKLLNPKSKFLLWFSTVIAFLPVYLVGFLVFYRYATLNSAAFSFATQATSFLDSVSPIVAVFVATTVIFMPQDFFIDHALAVGVYLYIRDLLEKKGVRLETGF